MCVIGLDVGTTGTKAVVADKLGTILGTGYQEYDLITKENNIVEQKAEDWWNAVIIAIKTACKNINKNEILALSLSTQGASMLAVDSEFKPLCNVITWMDKRAIKESEFLNKKIGDKELYFNAGWSTDSWTDSAKILWIKNNQPEIFNKTYSFVSTLEYINFKLTGKNISDPTNTSIRGLIDIRIGEWNKKVFDVLGIDEKKLPVLQPTGSLVGTLTKQSSKILELPEGVKVFNGAHDQYCASIGSGAIKNGDMLLATGTAWVVLGILDQLLYTKSRISPGIHPVKGLYGAMASLVSAGSALKWFKNIIDESYIDIDKMAQTRTESAKDLYFLPFVAGAGFPHSGKDLKSEIYGLTIMHDKYDIALALMEGVAFEAKTVINEFKKHGFVISKLYLAGRAAKSDLWRGLIRDITGCEVYLTEADDTCCIGAAILAAVGIGMHKDINQASANMVRIIKNEKPIPEKQKFYEQKYKKYMKLLNNQVNISN